MMRQTSLATEQRHWGGHHASIAAGRAVLARRDQEHPRWKAIRQNSVTYADAFKMAGGSIDLVNLPDAGIKGNSHMVMMDKNRARWLT